jgi:hypothetical protein
MFERVGHDGVQVLWGHHAVLDEADGLAAERVLEAVAHEAGDLLAFDDGGGADGGVEVDRRLHGFLCGAFARQPRRAAAGGAG